MTYSDIPADVLKMCEDVIFNRWAFAAQIPLIILLITCSSWTSRNAEATERLLEYSLKTKGRSTADDEAAVRSVTFVSPLLLVSR